MHDLDWLQNHPEILFVQEILAYNKLLYKMGKDFLVRQ